jgi:hypothetical protein
LAAEALRAGVSAALVAEILGQTGTATLYRYYTHAGRADVIHAELGKLRPG